jgi:ribosomal protein S18 acetylase RimI-like enzyme
MPICLRPMRADDAVWVRRFIWDHWGDDYVVAHGEVYYPHRLRGFVAASTEGTITGLATYHLQDLACELVTLNSTTEGKGIGTALLEAVRCMSEGLGCTRLWCVTTNDNLPALRFYQKRGFRIVAIHRNAVEAARQLKPTIPLGGIDNIPLLDEIELELRPSSAPA